jgi:uncharacterized protein (TIGR04255 family)
MIYEKVKDDFPNREARLAQVVEFVQTPQGMQQQIGVDQRVLLISEDGKSLIQVGSHLLAVSCLKPYPTWNAFKPKIEKAYIALVDTAGIRGLQRIGLRYINRIEIPSKSVPMERYFEFRPFLGSGLPQEISDFVVGCHFRFFDGRDTCKVQLNQAVPEEPGNVGYLLDLDYFLSQPQTIAPKQAIEWVDRAHGQIEEIFEGCITDRLREIFQEVK